LNSKRAIILFAGILCAAGFIHTHEYEPKLPPIKPVFDYPLRDPSVCIGPDGYYYLTGTTGYPTWWKTNDGIRVWKSKDLKEWTPLGVVWTFDKDASWQKAIRQGRRAIWAPEIHYLKGTFWLPYCVNYPQGGTGLLKSTTGRAEGPYVDVKPDGPLTSRIDASLFQDDDGKVYFVFQNGMVARMKDDLSGLVEEPRLLVPANHKEVGFEGAFLFKTAGKYQLIAADFNPIAGHVGSEGSYDCMAASSDNIYGPYSNRYLAIPHGGHNMMFRDRSGQWWSTIFGHDSFGPIHERFGLLRIEFDGNARIKLR
jgi:beta-xylosidase